MSDRKAIDEALEELDRLNDEKTLDEALDERERWGDRVSEAIAGMSTAEMIAYFREAEARFEKRLGKPVKKAKLQPRFVTEE